MVVTLSNSAETAAIGAVGGVNRGMLSDGVVVGAGEAGLRDPESTCGIERPARCLIVMSNSDNLRAHRVSLPGF